MSKNKIIISAEELSPVSDAVFVSLGRRGLSPRLPGYTVSMNGEVYATRDTIDGAELVARYIRDHVLQGNAIIIVS